MHQGNWKCSTCGGAITELPFQPRSEAGLTCRACYSKNKGGGAGQAPAPAAEPDLGPSAEAPYDIPDDAGVAGEQPPAPDDMDGGTPLVPGEKPKFEGDWSCAGCGGTISSLPFQPRDTSNLKCLDCFKASKG